MYKSVRNFIYTPMLNYGVLHGVSCMDLNDTHSYVTPDRSGNMGSWEYIWNVLNKYGKQGVHMEGRV